MTTVKMVKLGTLIKPAKLQKCGNDDYPVLSMTMHNGLVFQSDKFKKSVASQDKSTYKVVHRNQLVIGFPIDEGVLATQRITDVGIVSPAYGIWDVDQTKIIPEFLEYALRCNRAIDYYKAKLRGSTARRRSLPTPTLLELDVPLPDIEQQRLALTTIHHAKNALDSRQAQLTKLDELVKARFVEMFGDKNHPYESLINLVLDGTSLSYGIVQPGNDGTGDMGVLRPVDIVDGKLTMSSIKYIDRSIGEGFKKTELDGDELLITVRGTTGITALTDGRFAGMNVTRGIAVIRYNRKKINPLYLNAYFNTDESQRYIQEHTRGATLQQINLSDLRIQRIMLPPLSLQNQFAAFVAEVDKSKFVGESNEEKAWRLYSGILCKKQIRRGYSCL